MEKNLIFLLVLSVICKSVCEIAKPLEEHLLEPKNLDSSTASTAAPDEWENSDESKANVIKRDSETIEGEEDGNVNFENTENLSEAIENGFEGNTIEDANQIEQEDGFQKADWEQEELLQRRPNSYYNLPKINEPYMRPFYKDMNLPRSKINKYIRHKDIRNQMHVRYKLNPSVDLTVDKAPEHCSENKPIVINLKTECQACHHHPTTSHNFPKHTVVPKPHFFSHTQPKIHHHNFHHHHSPVSPRHNPLHMNTHHGSIIIPNHQNSLTASNCHHPVMSASCTPLISTPRQKSLISAPHHHPIMPSFYPLSVFCK